MGLQAVVHRDSRRGCIGPPAWFRFLMIWMQSSSFSTWARPTRCGVCLTERPHTCNRVQYSVAYGRSPCFTRWVAGRDAERLHTVAASVP